MKTIDDWFYESIEQYKTFLEMTAELCENAETLPLDDILKRCSRNKEIQEEIDIRDKKLHKVMNFLGPEVLENPLTGEYQRHLDAAIRETGVVADKIQERRDLLILQMDKEQRLRKKSFEYVEAINRYKSVSQDFV